jgi:hypothetical protein
MIEAITSKHFAFTDTLLHCCLYRMSGLGSVAGLLLVVCTNIYTLLLTAISSVSAVAALILLPVAVALLVVAVMQWWRVNSVK